MDTLNQYAAAIIPEVKSSVSIMEDKIPFGLTFREYIEYERKIESKKSAVRAAISRIGKNFVNVEENYNSTDASDVYEAVKDIMHDYLLGFSSEYESDETTTLPNLQVINRVFMVVTWTDLETGYSKKQRFLGTGLDFYDKGVYKAYTGAIKYALTLNFLIPSGSVHQPSVPAEPAEPEVQEVSDPKPEEKQTGKRKNKQQEEPEMEAKQPAAKISAKEVGEIKIEIERLNQLEDEKDRDKAPNAIVHALSSKIKRKIDDITEITVDEYAAVMKLLKEWQANKIKIKKMGEVK